MPYESFDRIMNFSRSSSENFLESIDREVKQNYVPRFGVETTN